MTERTDQRWPGLLYILPTTMSGPPLIDDLTRKMAAALRQATIGTRWRGWHTCICGARSGSCDYVLPNGQQTNSLAVHYLAVHRADVPEADLVSVQAFTFGEVAPTDDEISGRWATQ